ncbi:8-oxo-dGTP pyrophosphatase MutT, NUDIX family [Kushneria avicenniae]|uniref:8-oxo-dGTP pyrophosphatase MutT, NUDIX family n=1 Tax=Kushneria avicenniae TaxID=402385 RepID=A0A1I1I7M2_9GAMM|nr:CoA pyrophosphatase [Kushneria avicenniae]SFC32176.1 8-oxo-dGTP pyrophosphatase MutT, NUDIX family [Kushneria avicenniae]
MLRKAQHRLKDHRPAQIDGRHPRAAVLMPIINHDAPTLLLTRRNARLSSHAGQVAFPGGKLDPEDESLEACALRESFEEIGLPSERVSLLGRLSDRFSANGMIVTPFVGLIEPDTTFTPNPDEIDTIFEVELARLMTDPRQHTDVIRDDETCWYVPSYSILEHTLWGLSAMMVVELLNVAFQVDIGLDRYPESSILRHLPPRPSRRRPT